jgi:DNA end-binding protein Ku
MARSLWKGAISFGLVHIPVEMFPATSEHALDLTMLDRRDFSPVGFKRYNKGNDKEVGWDDIVKGYEYSEGEYVVLSDEDLRAANPEKTGAIDIVSFVDAGAVPLLYYDTPYYLAPAKGGDKVYALLRETLRKTGKIGIATVVIRVKQHLAALLCVDDTIVLQTLRYPDEIRATDDLSIPSASARAAAVTDKEIKMAMALVDGMSEAWTPAQYHDSYREDVLALVDKKVKARQTRTITAPDTTARPAPSSNVVDLVALLQQSLGKKSGGEKTATPARASKALPGKSAAPARKSAARRAPAASKPTTRRKAAAA